MKQQEKKMFAKDPLHLKLDIALEKLLAKRKELIANLPKGVAYGAPAARRPEGYVEEDKELGVLNFEWADQIRKENDECNEVLFEILAGLPRCDRNTLPKLTPDKVWVWGGPTPQWGGSMADDTLVRGADYFNAENAVYVYGPTTDKMMQMHSKYKKMLCQVNSNCRTAGALYHSEEENAALLSELSLKYPNIVGAMCDDYCTGTNRILLPERFEKIYRGTKKINKDLKVYGVVYAHELPVRNFQLVQDYVDVVNFWIWNKDEILDYDEHIARCQENFPGKPIIQGIFIHEYGRADVGNPPAILEYQLDKAREYMAKGVVEGIIILGDREIKKWPESAAAVKNYLLNQ